jgi:hypothetical protein
VGIIPVLDLNMDISLPVWSVDLIGRDLFAIFQDTTGN